MPNADGSETPQERMTRLLAQSHGAMTNTNAPIAPPSTTQVSTGHYDPATGEWVGGSHTVDLVEPGSVGGAAGSSSADSGFNYSDPNNLGKPHDENLSNTPKPPAQESGAIAPPVTPVGAAPNLSTGERATYAPDLTQSNADRAQQGAYLDSLRAAASGQEPSVAEAQMHQALSTAARNSLGIAAQARGGDAVAARRAAILGNASQGAQAAQGAAALRAQEIATARGQLGGALSDVRATDTGTALHTADQTSANQQLNLNRESGERIQGSALDQQRYATDVGAGTARYTADKNLAGVHYAADQGQKDKIIGGIIGGVATVGAAAAAASDERVKENIRHEAPGELDDFTKSLIPYSYRYKNPAEGAGERHGIMAQDLERSAIGRSTVRTGPDGVKRVDTSALTLALAGAVAQLAKDKRLGGGK